MTIRKAIVNLALKLQGTPYIWGGSSPVGGFDCSGFVVWVLQVFEVLPSGDWTAEDLRKQFEYHFFREDLVYVPALGDLVYYGSHLATVTHVGIYIGNGQCVLCSGGDSTTTTPELARQRNAQVKVKNVHYRLDFIGYGHFNLPEDLI